MCDVVSSLFQVVLLSLWLFSFFRTVSFLVVYVVYVVLHGQVVWFISSFGFSRLF